MRFLEKMAIICLAQFVMIPRTHTKPHTFLHNNPVKGTNKYTRKNYFPSMQATTDIKNSDTNSDSILKAFNFHDIEYPVAATPRPQQFYFQDFNDNQGPLGNIMPDAGNIKTNSDLKPAKNSAFNNLQKLVKSTFKSNANNPKGLSVLAKEFTSSADFRCVGNFPEVEYPLSARETWKPNYWSIPFEGKDVNALIADSQLTQNLANIHSRSNFGINNNSGKCRTFSIKSFSDAIKNKERLKQILENNSNTSSKQNNSACRNDAIVNCEKNFPTNDIKSLPIVETIQELHTTSMPYYFTSVDTSLNCEEFNVDNSNTFSIFNKNSVNNNYLSIPLQNSLTSNEINIDNPFTHNNALNFEEISALLNNNDKKHINSNDVQEMNYEPYDIDVRKPEIGSDVCGLDDDYTTGIYSDENNLGWFSQPVSTPSPFSATVDLTWKNCKTITPCEFIVDDLEDYYISV